MSLEDIYLRDLYRNEGDLTVSLSGDIESVGLLENLRQALLHRLITRKGTVIHRPDFGVGIQLYQNAPMTFERKRKLAVEIDAQFRKDPRVVRVVEVKIAEMEGNPYGVTISVKVDVRGYGAAQFDFAIGDELV